METAKIFNVIYSDVSEDIKNIVLDTALYEMGPELSFTMLTEDYSDGLSEMLTDYVDIVAHNAVSEEDLDEALEQVLEAVDTDTINTIAESFMDREVRRALFEREETINELFGFGKKSPERAKAENYLKAQGASAAKANAGLKSALNTQKANLKAIRSSNPIGLSAINKNTSIMAGDKIRVGKAQKKADVESNAYEIAKRDLSNIKNKERQEAINKVKGAAKSVWNKFTGAVKKGAEAVKNKAIETKDKAVGATKKAIAKGAGAVASGAMKVANAATKVKTAAEKPSNLTAKADTITKTKAELEAERKNIEKFLGTEGIKGYQRRYYGNKLKAIKSQLGESANEAFETALELIASSNISESAFMDIMEVLNTLKITPRGLKRSLSNCEADTLKVADDMEKTLEKGFKVTPQQIQRIKKNDKKYKKLKDRLQKYIQVG